MLETGDTHKSGQIRLEKSQASWFAVYTKPRQEHIALENLERQDFPLLPAHGHQPLPAPQRA